MEKKQKIEIAAEMLRESVHYVGNRNDADDDVSFDFIISEDGEEMDVFRASFRKETFFWTDVTEPICEALRLSSYIHLTEIPFGKDKYGTDITKSTISVHIR